MHANNSLSLNSQYAAICKETRTFIYDYTTHGSDYKKELLSHLSYPDARYEHFTLQAMFQNCLTPLALHLGHQHTLQSPQHAYRDIDIFLQYFANGQPNSSLHHMAEGDLLLAPLAKTDIHSTMRLSSVDQANSPVLSKPEKHRKIQNIATVKKSPKRKIRSLTLLLLTMTVSITMIFSFLFLTYNAPQKKSVMPTAIIGLPLRLKIPRIHVDAAIQQVGRTADGAMDVPTNADDAGWYNLGPKPGEIGNAVIAGHFDGMNGSAGVFAKLQYLKPGDKVYVTNDKGTTDTFTVRESRTYQPTDDALEVFNQREGRHLNLITCDGIWNKSQKSYSKRLVVFTDAAGVK